MARRAQIFVWLVLVGIGVLVPAGAGAQESGIAYLIEFDGTVDPATERWIDQALGDAADEGAELAIIELDTEGGLDTSMREIIKDILAAPMPVVVYVAPEGSRAASAGAFITEAGDVAAMDPQTNIGSASPVSIGGGDVDEVLGREDRERRRRLHPRSRRGPRPQRRPRRAARHRGRERDRGRGARRGADRSRRRLRAGAARRARRLRGRRAEGADARHRRARDRAARDALPARASSRCSSTPPSPTCC